MFEDNPIFTPYHYCKNNPVKRIDPTGEDDYEVNRKTGEITLLKKTDDKTDRLVAQNHAGKVKYKKDGSYKKSITVEKTVMENREVNGKEQRLDFGGGKDAENKAIEVFNFLADNTEVEWGAVGYGSGSDNMNSVATSGDIGTERSASVIARDNSANGNLNYYHHSHPGRKGTNNYPSQGLPGEGGDDVGYWQSVWKNSPNAIMGIRAWKSTQLYKENKNNKKGYSPIINR